MIDYENPYDFAMSLQEKQKEQKPAGWSEEDEEMLEYVIGDVNDAKELFATKEAIDLCDKEIAWLKSLRPQPHWKPNEEQMEAFKGYIEGFQARAEAAVGGWNNFDVMIRLYEQLKKL